MKNPFCRICSLFYVYFTVEKIINRNIPATLSVGTESARVNQFLISLDEYSQDGS